MINASTKKQWLKEVSWNLEQAYIWWDYGLIDYTLDVSLVGHKQWLVIWGSLQLVVSSSSSCAKGAAPFLVAVLGAKLVSLNATSFFPDIFEIICNSGKLVYQSFGMANCFLFLTSSEVDQLESKHGLFEFMATGFPKHFLVVTHVNFYLFSAAAILFAPCTAGRHLDFKKKIILYTWSNDAALNCKQ